MGFYFTYITTNPARSVLYVGMTNDLADRMLKHYQNRGQKKTFAGRYYCYILIYYEEFRRPIHAIEREKQLKRWSRAKKEALINSINPGWHSLNNRV